MKEIANSLKIVFFIDNNVLLPREGFEHTKLADDGSLHLDLTTLKGNAILDILKTVKTIHIDGIVYNIKEYEYVLEGTALFIVVEERKKEKK